MKQFYRAVSKPQVIQPLVTDINDYTSSEDISECDFVNGEPTLTCRILNLYLLNCVILGLELGW